MLWKEKEACVPEVGRALDRTMYASTERSKDSSEDSLTERDTTIDPPRGFGCSCSCQCCTATSCLTTLRERRATGCR